MENSEQTSEKQSDKRAERAGAKLVCEGFKSLGKETKKAAGGGKLILFANEGRDADDAAAALALEGFNICKTEVGGRILSRYPLLNEKSYPECVSAVVGVGDASAMEAAKAFRKARSLACVLFPTDFSALNALTDEAFFFTSCGIAAFPAPVRTVLLDEKKILSSPCVSSGIGLFFSRFVGVLDGAYEKLVQKLSSPAPALAALRASAGKIAGINEENAGKKIFEAILDLEASVKEKGLSSSLSCLSLAALAAGENGGEGKEIGKVSGKERGEDEKTLGSAYPEKLFVAAYSLLRLYAFYLKTIPLDRALPPDRAQNIERLVARCGLDRSFLFLRPGQTFAEGAEKRNELTAEYRDDLLGAIKSLPLDAACRAVRRLPKTGAPDPSAESLLTLVSLTGELVSGYPLIKHIKTTGFAEPLLSCG